VKRGLINIIEEVINQYDLEISFEEANTRGARVIINSKTLVQEVNVLIAT